MFLGYVVFQLFCSYNSWQCNDISQVESVALLLYYVTISHVYYTLIIIIIFVLRKLGSNLLG